MKSLFEQFGGTYYNESDYLIPNLLFGEGEESNLSIYGQRYLNYLQEHHKLIYISLLTSGKLNSYLVDIDTEVQERFELLVAQMKDTQGISEQLKSEKPMEWVGRMNFTSNDTYCLLTNCIHVVILNTMGCKYGYNSCLFDELKKI